MSKSAQRESGISWKAAERKFKTRTELRVIWVAAAPFRGVVSYWLNTFVTKAWKEAIGLTKRSIFLFWKITQRDFWAYFETLSLLSIKAVNKS
jgi:hypothetical protein